MRCSDAVRKRRCLRAQKLTERSITLLLLNAMKTMLRLTGWTSWVFTLGAFACFGQETGTVLEDRLNVRGQPSLAGEVITQLKKGETVSVLEEIAASKPKPGEPAKWLRIQMPANTPVWVSAAYIDAATKTTKPNRLNVRAGPGENFSVVARLEGHRR